MLSNGKSVAQSRPEIIQQWSDKNTLTPEEVLPGSAQPIWWNCEAGHDPFLSPVSRYSSGRRCPKCARISRVAAIAYAGPRPGKSLADLRPDLVELWDPRNTIKPSEVGAGSGQMASWVCPADHSYEMSVKNRARAMLKFCPCCKAASVAARKAVSTR